MSLFELIGLTIGAVIFVFLLWNADSWSNNDNDDDPMGYA